MEEQWKKVEPPKAHPPISVNVDEWMQQKHDATLSFPGVTDETLEKIKAAGYPEGPKERVEKPKECAECAQTKPHYLADYICIDCRRRADE